MHPYYDTATSLITQSRYISKNATTSLLWFIFSRTIIRDISMFSFFKFNVIFRFTHEFQLFYRKSRHRLFLLQR